MAGCKGSCEGGGNLVVGDETNEGGKPVEVGLCGGVLGLVESKGSESFWEVPKGARGFALLETSECLVKDGRVNGDGWRGGVATGGSMGGLVGGWWGVQLLASCLYFGGDGCHWH